MSVEITKRLFNRDEYYRMADAGILGEDDPVELIEGEIMDRYAGEKWHFTTADYYRMLEAGILTEDDRVELIEGEVIQMTPIGKRHAACVKRLNALLGRRFGDAVIVSVQDPIHLSEGSDPQPDLALLRPRTDFYAQSHPTPADVLLLIEVADTSVEFDREM